MGLLLALVVSWSMVFFSLTLEPYTFPETTANDTPFARELKDLDILLSSPVMGDRAIIEKALGRLEKKARSQEERLSALKRWRNLARRDSRFAGSYIKAAGAAAGDFAYSEAMAAVAAEALFFNGGFPAIEKEDSPVLETYISRIRGDFFLPLLISLRVLKGDLRTPHLASEVPDLEKTLASGLSRLSQRSAASLVLNEALLWTLKDDVPTAGVKMNNLLASRGDEERVLRAAAGFFYDHGNFLRAAELFARLPGDEDTAREAGALALAGETGRAGELWRLLASPRLDGRSGDGGSRARSLYNLAAASVDASDLGEEKAWLEKLFAALNTVPGETGVSPGTPAAVFGLIFVIIGFVSFFTTGF
jgi:hypothetical protein